MAFWSNPQEFAEPLKQNRWLLRITSLDGANIISVEAIKECSKPSFKIGTTEHKLLNNTYKYPTTVKWNPVTIKFLNIKDGFVWSSESLKLRTKYIDYSQFNILSNISKSEIKFNFDIQQLDENGRVVEAWSLYNAFFSSMENGNLSYSDDNFVEMTAEIQYDWAELINYEPLNGLDVDLRVINQNNIPSKNPQSEVDLFESEYAKNNIPNQDLYPVAKKELQRPVKFVSLQEKQQKIEEYRKQAEEVRKIEQQIASEQAKIKAAGGGLEVPKQVSTQEYDLESTIREEQGVAPRQRRAIGTEQNAESTADVRSAPEKLQSEGGLIPDSPDDTTKAQEVSPAETQKTPEKPIEVKQDTPEPQQTQKEAEYPNIKNTQDEAAKYKALEEKEKRAEEATAAYRENRTAGNRLKAEAAREDAANEANKFLEKDEQVVASQDFREGGDLYQEPLVRSGKLGYTQEQFEDPEFAKSIK